MAHFKFGNRKSWKKRKREVFAIQSSFLQETRCKDFENTSFLLEFNSLTPGAAASTQPARLLTHNWKKGADMYSIGRNYKCLMLCCVSGNSWITYWGQKFPNQESSWHSQGTLCFESSLVAGENNCEQLLWDQRKGLCLWSDLVNVTDRNKLRQSLICISCPFLSIITNSLWVPGLL